MKQLIKNVVITLLMSTMTSIPTKAMNLTSTPAKTANNNNITVINQYNDKESLIQLAYMQQELSPYTGKANLTGINVILNGPNKINCKVTKMEDYDHSFIEIRCPTAAFTKSAWLRVVDKDIVTIEKTNNGTVRYKINDKKYRTIY